MIHGVVVVWQRQCEEQKRTYVLSSRKHPSPRDGVLWLCRARSTPSDPLSTTTQPVFYTSELCLFAKMLRAG